jgi:ribosomal-protein-alanine N-acetyltransferase
MRFPESYRLQTARCILRPASMKDIPQVFSASQFPGFTEGMRWDPPAQMDELAAPHQRGIDAWNSGTSFGFTFTLKESDELIGRVGIRPEHDDVWSIGFWTHPDFQSKGYVTEAASAILDFGFRELNATCIEADHALWNDASARVLLKIGMVFQKNIAEGFQKRGAWVEVKQYAISRAAWLERQT